MKILYVDESFKKNHYYLVCGVLIDAGKYRRFNDKINNLFSRLNTPIRKENELKAYDLYHGKGIWKNASSDDRDDDISKIIDFLANYNGLPKDGIILAYKKNVAQDFEENANAYLSLLKEIVKKSTTRVKAGGKTGKQLLVIFDERKDLEIDKRVSRTIRETSALISREHGSSCTVIDCGYSGDSKFSRMLQLADFLAYSIRRKFFIQKSINDYGLEKIFNKCKLYTDEKWKPLNKLKTYE